jgi:hypothetical protein
MTLKQLDLTEDRNFINGETVYDVDGNAYTVVARFGTSMVAVLNRCSKVVYDLMSKDMILCFSRTNPRAS